MADNEMQAREKMEMKSPAESTRNVPVYIPAVDIYESQDALVLVADMPGVGSDSVSIDIRDNQLTLRGTIQLEPGDKERVLLQEYGVGDYFREFTLGRAIDQAKIEASMKDGVLTHTLPKADIVKPRKITVKEG
jgi:HSP20 family protein